MSRFGFRKHRLIGVSGDYTIAISPRNVLCSKDRFNSRMIADKLSEIGETESCPVIRAADRTHCERSGGNLVSTENLATINLLSSVDPNQSLSNSPRSNSPTRGERSVRLQARFRRACINNRGDDLSVASASAQHATDRVRNGV